jgi:SAM-dependent methyltransferase
MCLRFATTIACLALLLPVAQAQAARDPRFPAPGRPVAGIVSPSWGDTRQRDAAKEIEQIAARLGLRPGMAVADIGAGDGYDTLRLARLLGPAGRVYAEDVTTEYLKGLASKARRQGLRNVVVVQGEPRDPRLPRRSLDAAMMVHMYHEITEPYALLYNLAWALRPGAKVGVEDLPQPTAQHGTPPALLRCEFEAVGYRQLSTGELAGGLGYLSIFEAPRTPVMPAPDRFSACRALAAGAR